MNKKPVKPNLVDFNISFEVDKQELANNKVVKRKKLEMKPMDEEEAILQMELLGHEFFVYQDVDAENVCILYKRKDGNYGIIETN